MAEFRRCPAVVENYSALAEVASIIGGTLCGVVAVVAIAAPSACYFPAGE